MPLKMNVNNFLSIKFITSFTTGCNAEFIATWYTGLVGDNLSAETDLSERFD